MKTVFYPLGGRRGPSSKEECGLCGRVLPTYSLRRCFRCGRLYCGSCITEDLVEGKYLICLNCAMRFASPKKGFRSKYTSLSIHLAQRAQWTKWVKLTFAKIEEIIGEGLPPSALQNQKWWNNVKSSVQGQAWLSVGWKLQNVDLENGTVIFIRPDIIKAKRKSRRKNLTKTSLPKFEPRKVKFPSKTRIAKAQARLQNVVRKKSSPRQYRGKFKPKPAYEKRLYKPEMNPAL